MNYFNYFKFATLLLASFMLFSCSTNDNDEVEPDDEILPPIELSCDFFNEDQTLEDDPQRPVDYLIDCTVLLESNLEIEPGTVISFGQGAGIIVQADGSLNASGTKSDTIVFTATTPQNGWWGGLEFRSNNNNKISYAIVEYAGATTGPGGVGGLGDVGYGAVLVYASASLDLTNSVIKNSIDVGLSIAPRGSSGESHQPLIDAIHLSGNTYTANAAPVRIPFYIVGNLDPNDDYSGNENDRIMIRRGNIEKAVVTMNALNVPYLALGNLDIHRGTENSKSQLIIQPGVELEMGSDLGISVLDGPNYLTAQGTAQEPIHIRGENPTPGFWGQIHLNHSEPNALSVNILEHVNISHGSAGDASDLWNGVVSLNLSHTLIMVMMDVHFADYSGTSCPVGGTGDWNRLEFSNLTDDLNRLPACIGD